MSFSSRVLPCLALRSADTLETLSKSQQRYQLISSEAPELANVIHACVNLQKKDTGLSGLMYEMQGESLLNCTDMLTEEVFRGVSVVKCNINEIEAIALMQQKDELSTKLDAFLSNMHAAKKNKAGMLLDQILPSAEGRDFWWFGQTCELKGGASMRDCILLDGKRGDVVFYDAFSCIGRAGQDAGADLSFKDACIWDPVLHGSVGIYTQRAGDGNSVFLVCVSDFDQIASDIVRSMKADLGNTTNVYDFCTSKEMWFLEKIVQRNRQRLILQTAEHLGICVPRKTDLYAHPKQDKPDLAIECCGVNLDHIECSLQHNTLTHHATPVVRHYKDCIDVLHRSGTIPVVLCDNMGFVLLLPDKLSHASFANHNDTPPFVQNRTGRHTHLCPTHNIFEKNYSSVQKIIAEQQNVVHVTISDLLYDMQQQGIGIHPHEYDLLTSTDEYGNFLFYGAQHGAGTPTLIYPHIRPAFMRTLAGTTHTLPDAPALSDKDKGVAGDAQSDNTPPHFGDAQSEMPPQMPPTSTASHARCKHIDVCSVMCEVCVCETVADSELSRLFDFHMHMGADNPARMQLEWSELAVGLVQKTARMPHIDTLFLLPHATFCNYTASVL